MKKIKLTQGKFAQVDDDLFEELNRFKWCAYRDKNTFYAMRKATLRNGRRRTYKMHREVFRLRGEKIPKLVDHSDQNGLNNQRINLRGATKVENARNQRRRPDNTSGFSGVWRDNSKFARGCWKAQVRIKGKRKHLGYFDDLFSAAWVRDKFMKSLDPEFAVTHNLIDRRTKNVPVSVDRRRAL